MATTVSRSITLELGYKETDFTRKYIFNDVSEEALTALKGKVQNYNANLPDDDKKIFISDDYDDENPADLLGTLTGIIGAEYKITTTTPIE